MSFNDAANAIKGDEQMNIADQITGLKKSKLNMSVVDCDIHSVPRINQVESKEQLHAKHGKSFVTVKLNFH